ncbi:MAG: pyruvate ferredoxin oxidoreductase [Coriobacteriia bacterium]|nr:pyruvate ferredoxin oxidoreductase [Coriobacteriia bacterium]
MRDVKVVASSGDLMIAEAFRQIDPDVVAAYPITPQTIIVERFAKFVADGLVHTEYVQVESEHSAMSATIGASAAGARAATATASQGLAFMWEELHVASGMRLPIVMANANRALSAPINIHGDHSDAMGSRDTGWIMLFAENAQEAYDNTILAFKIAEHPEVRLPVMSCLDGFVTSHALERCEINDDQDVKDFVGPNKPQNALLDTDNPVSHGMFANLGNVYMEVKYAERLAMENSLPIIKNIGDEWEQVCGRPFAPINTFGLEDAEKVVVIIGSAAGNFRAKARELRAQGEKVGVIGVRLFRPFPYQELAEALSKAKAVAVLDRADSFGSREAPLCLEVKSALYDAENRPLVRNYVYGLGGADVTMELCQKVFEDLDDLMNNKKPAREVSYVGGRSKE